VRIVIRHENPESIQIKAGEFGSQADRFSLDYINKANDFEDSVAYMAGHLSNDPHKASLRFPRVVAKQ